MTPIPTAERPAPTQASPAARYFAAMGSIGLVLAWLSGAYRISSRAQSDLRADGEMVQGGLWTLSAS
jgi:hypothetical protein